MVNVLLTFFFLQVNPKFPDFKCKVGDRALWLDGAPGWVLSELEGVEFDVKNLKLRQRKGEHGKGFLFTIPLLCIENTIGRCGFRLLFTTCPMQQEIK